MLRVVVALMALCFAGCSDSSRTESDSRPTHTASQQAPATVPGLPDAEQGAQWLGVNAVMIAVPKEWVVTPHGCTGKLPGAIIFQSRHSWSLRCPSQSVTETTLLVDDTGEGRHFRSLKPLGQVHGLEVTGSGLGCRTSRPPTCSLSFAVQDAQVSFSITVRAANAGRVLEGIRDSIRPIPAGYTAVPDIAFTSSVEKAEQILQAAGLDAHSPEVDWPHYVTGARPTAGTVVPRGSVIELSIGDG